MNPREIKFRGISVMDEKFCYGFLTEKQSGNRHIGFHGHYNEAYQHQLVRQNSVGQFTGLLDKNGIEIYEGDIVEIKTTIRNYDDDDMLNPRFYRVRQHEDIKSLHVIDFIKGTFRAKHKDGVRRSLCVINESCIEVIGNIHQNPELLT